MIVGTLHYMRPEQLLGRPVDAGSDLFSAGVVLHEMATGRLPFPGVSFTETMDRILHAAPEKPGPDQRRIHPGLERIVLRCLEKDPAKRYRTASDLKRDLAELAESLGGRRRAGSGRALAAAGLASVAVLLAALGLSYRRSSLARWEEATEGRIRELSAQSRYFEAFDLAAELEERIPGNEALREISHRPRASIPVGGVDRVRGGAGAGRGLSRGPADALRLPSPGAQDPAQRAL